MKRYNWILTFLLCPIVLFGQTFSPERTGGVYFAYPEKSTPKVHLPDGFEVFYISHYGRHGSRWLPDEARYEWVNAQFADDANLTPFGKSVKRRLKKVWKNAKGHAGQLTPLGVRQHQGIARRMAERFPTAFQGDDAKILARSSTVPRCRASMLAFCGELTKHFPALEVNPETEQRFMAYINHESAELKTLTKKTKRYPCISSDRFVNALFVNPSLIEEPLKLMSELHTIASDMQDIPLNVSLWDCFTEEEMLAVHDANNERMTLCNGDTLLNDGIPARSSIALWQNIEQEAEAMIASGGHGASLRFGHDTALYRLLTLMEVLLPGNGMEDFLPMAANFQMVFCRRNGERSDSVFVAFFLNERPSTLHLQPSTFRSTSGRSQGENLSPSTFNRPPSTLYSWEAVKSHMKERIHNLEHLRQLSALNTMVGTAPANTKTAGLFGKGTEEHGQTLPAVLTPNGQTFWTPQTRDTEKKCVAPYYYTDSLFQGIRASHWLVGGCTQDYGSFTIAALTGEKRLHPNERATRFSHDEEVSHPYYYKVYLPDEQLQVELTALSHSAILRVTPRKDGDVHIVIQSNSDEQEGGVTIDTLHRQVYAFNPVHRIYQGWGERAGFSGHLVLTYADDIADYSQSGQIATLTFKGRKGHPIILCAATSFTGREGAFVNLAREAYKSYESYEDNEDHCIQPSFDIMMQWALNAWRTRFHTIDIEDPDTAKVNQFYGAFYRASFLPREMSDCDGSRPRFANGQLSNGKFSNCKYFGDFSMWDTYRALHPLYNIIVPEVSGDMMQSLVDMYKEGGWLPIFPCWNSYTAAMIGDHCSSVLADAYVKGIRNFDVETAYEAMRKNAMESPKTDAEYLNGMGRRALQSYIKYGYIPLEDSVKEAFHTNEQTSRTLEYAYDDFCVGQLAEALGKEDDYYVMMRRSENWRNVINPQTGYADGRHADGSWENNTDITHRKPYITEGATCHYTWYVPHNIAGLIKVMGGREAFVQKLDSMFTEGRYWHGNEPCHQVAWLYNLAGRPEKTRHWVRHILEMEYNDTPGGLSGNDDAGQMSAWQMFAMMGFYPLCPGYPNYQLSAPVFRRIVINQANGRRLLIESPGTEQISTIRLNGGTLPINMLDHKNIVEGSHLVFQ